MGYPMPPPPSSQEVAEKGSDDGARPGGDGHQGRGARSGTLPCFHLQTPGVREFRLGAGDFIGVHGNVSRLLLKVGALPRGGGAPLATVLTVFVCTPPPPGSARTSMNHVDEIRAEE